MAADPREELAREQLARELAAEQEGAPRGHSGPSGLAFWFALIFHLIDGFVFNFSVASSSIIFLRLAIYIILAFWLSSTLTWRISAGLAALEFIAPWIIWLTASFISNQAAAYLLLIWAITSPIALYISWHKSGGKFWSYMGLWRWALIILFILMFLNIIWPMIPEADLEERLVVQASMTAVDMVKSMTKNVWHNLMEGIGIIPAAIEKSINYATGGYYTGLVEQQQGAPVGLYIDRLRFSNDIYYEGDDAYLWADMQGKSFNDEITVTTNCFTHTGKLGEVDPEQFVIYQEGFESVQCKFENLSQGSYTVYFNAGFNFETWSYVTYTFVDQELLLNLLSQDKDVNRELDVQRILRPVYTPGPVSLGMSSNVLQPVGVSMDKGLNTVFGATLDNHWTEGEIKRVREFLMLVPKEFSLSDCDVDPVSYTPDEDPFCDVDPERCAEDMKAYRFDLRDSIKTFKSVTCRLRLAEGVEPESIIPLGQRKAQRTFVVMASYDYTLTEKRTLGVMPYVRY